MSVLPKWYKPVAIIALVWNLLGCFAYLADVMIKPEDIARMPAAQQELYAARTVWSVSATAIAVWFGAAGSLGLVMRKRWATPLLIGSLIGLIVQDFGLFILVDGVKLAGPAALVIQGLVLLIAVGLVVLARKAGDSGWIPNEAVSQG